jgi:hypothetical protein
MTEEYAKIALQDVVDDDEEVARHLALIRRMSKGYFSEPDAKAYIEALTSY